MTNTTIPQLSLTPCEDGGVTVTVDGSSLTEVFEKATHYSTLKFSQPELKETSNVYCTSVEDPFNIWVQLGTGFLFRYAWSKFQHLGTARYGIFI